MNTGSFKQVRHEVDLTTRDAIFNALVREAQHASEDVAFHLVSSNPAIELSRIDIEAADGAARRASRLMDRATHISRFTPEETVVLLNAESRDTQYMLVYSPHEEQMRRHTEKGE